MKMTLAEFERNFFNPERVKTYLEQRESWIQEYKATDDKSRWTLYFMLLGTLSSHGRISKEEYQKLGPDLYQAKSVPTPERLYTLTALVDLMK